jgi:L-fucose isomerase-like protein
MKKIVIGLVPTRRFCFSIEDAIKYKRLVEEKLRELKIEFINIDTINEEGLLVTMDDAKKTVNLLKDKGVDAIFSPHVNFGTEEVVAYVGREMKKPFLLWGPRDEEPLASGEHLRDTQCGLFATSNVLKKYNVPFTYIVNSRVDSELFKRGLLNFVAAVRVVKNFIGARIGQISTRPSNFYTVIVNEQELLTNWGIELVPITLFEIKNKMEQLIASDSRIKDETEKMKKKIALQLVTEKDLAQIAALKILMLDWAEEKELSAIAIRCHDDLPNEMQFYSCFANGEVTAAGIPVACETDIHGAISSILVQSASNITTETFFADMTMRHPQNNNAELLWHCGNFPYSMCKNCDKAFLGRHCNIKPALPGTGNFEIEAPNITVARFDGMNGKYSLLIGEGKQTEGSYNLGTYVWMEVENWPEWEERLIYGPYVHHVAGVSDHCAAALYEATKYIPGLIPDPVHPTEKEIRAYLRGDDLNE